MKGMPADAGAPLGAKRLPSLRGFRASTLFEDVTILKAWILSLDVPPIDQHLAYKASVVLALHGFKRPDHLVGLQPADLESLFEHTILLATIRRAVQRQEGLRHVWAASKTICNAGSSALAMAEQLTPAVFEASEAAVLDMEVALGVPDLGLSLHPRAAIEKLVAA